jgi:hypothetical protein
MARSFKGMDESLADKKIQSERQFLYSTLGWKMQTREEKINAFLHGLLPA